MAVPRVFICSTFYDLRHVREDLERFIKELGYEPVRSETGAIPYGKDAPPEEYAYREVELCDIVVSIIGGRFGSQSQGDQGSSVSQKELRRALELGIQVFIFIEKSVLAEYHTYLLNKDNEEIKYRFVDDVRIYKFIESLHSLPRNNPIAPFETSADIIDYLRRQWAGLFQRFLQEQRRAAEVRVIEEMKTAAETLKELIRYLTEERRNKDEAIKSILLASHPAFRRFAEVTGTSYRVFFTNKKELQAWLSARGWLPSDEANLDEDSVMEWSNRRMPRTYLKLTHDIFDSEGRLKIYTEDDWKDEWITLVEAETARPNGDVPF